MRHIYIWIVLTILSVKLHAQDTQSVAKAANVVSFKIKIVNDFGGDSLNLDIDTLALFYFDNGLSDYTDERLPHKEILSVKSLDGYFYFHIPKINKPQYFSLGSYKRIGMGYPPNGKTIYYMANDFFNPVLSMYLMEPGDDVTMTLAGYIDPSEKWKVVYNLTFQGTGSAKYICRFNTDNFQSRIDFGNMENPMLFEGHYMVNNGFDKRTSLSLNVIDGYKSLISDIAYNVLRADIFSEFELQKYRIYDYRIVPNLEKTKISEIVLFGREMLAQKEPSFSNEAKLISKRYADMQVQKMLLGTTLFSKKDYNAVFNKILLWPDINLKEKLIAQYLNNYNKAVPELTNTIDRSLTIVKDPYLRGVIENLNHLKIGNPAFNFSLRDTTGKTVQLADFKNKVVFMDFWYVGCTACAKYFKGELLEVEHQFKENPNVFFITVALDGDLSQWKRGLASGNYTSEEAINVYTNGQGWKHEIVNYYNITGAPFPIVIDGKGNLFAVGNILRTKEKLTAFINQAIAKLTKN
ncbi:Thioredoxin-like [bacterium A37T11]|nr:Thioredoxin-like [bacterium A37T11]